ncbi:hypothetical protein [Romboutsia ilealis]|uniref:hypothetical protein n=1 Tax=Romboutsia ilealis TaxID=1115758 RepID=UPI00272CBC1C|nr:hypothetical protein [Romboutsia ilealis]
MYTLDYNDLINLVLNVCLYFMVATLGAFIKDVYNSITKKDEVIRVKRILVGSIFATFVLLAIEDYILSKQTINIVIFISFIMGGIGFELFGKWVNLDIVERYIKSRFK